MHGINFGQGINANYIQGPEPPSKSTQNLKLQKNTNKKVQEVRINSFQQQMTDYISSTPRPGPYLKSKIQHPQEQILWQKVDAGKDDLARFSEVTKKGGAFRSIIDDGMEKKLASMKKNLASIENELKSGKNSEKKFKELSNEFKELSNKFKELSYKFEDLQEVMDGESLKSTTLSNGKVLNAKEHAAISIYTSHLYNLFNNSVSNKDAYLEDFMKTNFIPLEKKDELKTLALEVSVVLASALNKLPPYEGPLYRGCALTKTELNKYQEGTVLIDPKFLSYSIDSTTSRGFAEDTAAKKTNFSGQKAIPTLIVIQSSNAKDIDQFSIVAGEGEKMYVPGQVFESLGVSKGEGKLKGFNIITLRELNLKEEIKS